MTVASTDPGGRRRVLALLLSVGLALSVGAIGGLATASSIPDWYAGLAKPGFNPPNAVFGPVWTTLYVLMAVASWRVWRTPRDSARSLALALYAVQLALNLLWSLVFFGLRQPGWALGEIALLLAAVLGTAAAFSRKDRTAALLLVPYAAWVAFASVLNLEIWRLN